MQRRRVLRVAAAYAAMGFIVAQAADIVQPALALPEWTMTLVVVLLLLGFPFAVVLAWFFDISPSGVRRTEDVAAAADESRAVAGERATAARPPLSSRSGAIAAAAMALVLVGATAMIVLRGNERDSATTPEVSVAVLPFKNGSGATDTEYFSDGLTEAIGTRLNRIEGLRVTSNTSAMLYKTTSKRMREIAQELGVDHVVEGSVRLSGTRMRISARLIEAATDRTLWSDTFDRDFEDVFAVETEIAERIAEGMRVRLTPSQRGRIGERGTNSVAAYDLYMKARRMLRESRSIDWNEQRSTFYSAIALLRQSLEADPQYAVAWAELSRLYRDHIDLGFEARLDSARAMAERAIRFAPQLADGYVAMGDALGWGPDSLAAQQYDLALQREPNHVGALLAAARLARGQLRLVERARLLHRAAQLAPTDPDPVGELSLTMSQLGDYESAARLLDHTVRLSPGAERWEVALARAELAGEAGDTATAARQAEIVVREAPAGPAVWLSQAHLQSRRGQLAAAVRNYEKYAESLRALPDVDGIPAEEKWYAWYNLGYTLVAFGDTVRGNGYLRDAERANLEFRRRRCPGTCRNTALARLYAFRGDADRAIEFLQHSIDVGWVGTYPGSPVVAGWFRNIADDPRYRKIMGDLIADFDSQREQVRRERLHIP